MTNYGAKILNTATKSLTAQQAIIANLSNNIANVNTPGYSRRVVTLQTGTGSRNFGGGIDVGNGVDVAGIQRMADEYLNKLLREKAGSQASSEVQNGFLSRVDSLFSIDGSITTISTNLSKFFGAINDLTTDPSNIQLRKVVIERANSLITSISGTYNTIAAMQDEADSRVSTEVQALNDITEQIASLNQTISSIEQGGNATAADARDQREVLLQELAKKVSYQTVEQSDGQMNIYLTNGFCLVAGARNYDLSVTTNPSFAGGTVPPSLSGRALSYITYDYSGGAGTGDFDLTEVIQNGEGSLGGLLKIRGYNDYTNMTAFDANGTLVEVASRVEALAQDLLTSFNFTYQGDDEDSGTAGFQSNALDLDGNTAAQYGFFDFEYLGNKDPDSDGRPSIVDLSSILTTPGSGIYSFASILKLTSTDPRDIAAARDQNAAAGALTLVPGDGSNAAALAALQDAERTFSAGSFSLTGTFDDVYNELIQHVSGAVTAMQNRAELDRVNYTVAQGQRDEVSAVSLDEEFTSLITHQQAYQASAKMIKTADELLQIVIGLLG